MSTSQKQSSGPRAVLLSSSSPRWSTSVPNLCMSPRTLPKRQPIAKWDSCPITSTPTKTHSSARALFSKSDDLQQRLDTFRDRLNQSSFNQAEDDEDFLDGTFWSESQPDVCFSQKASLTRSGTSLSSFLYDRPTSMPSFPGNHSSSEDDLRRASLHLRTLNRRAIGTVNPIMSTPQKQSSGFRPVHLSSASPRWSTSVPNLCMSPRTLPKKQVTAVRGNCSFTSTPTKTRSSTRALFSKSDDLQQRLDTFRERLNQSSFNQDKDDEEFVDGTIWSESQPDVCFSQKASLTRSGTSLSSFLYDRPTSMPSFPGIHSSSEDDMRRASLHLRTTNRIVSQYSLHKTSSMSTLEMPKELRQSSLGQSMSTLSMTPAELRRSSNVLPMTPKMSPQLQLRASISQAPSTTGTPDRIPTMTKLSKPRKVTAWAKLKKKVAPKLRTSERKESKWTPPKMSTPSWFPSVSLRSKRVATPSPLTSR